MGGGKALCITSFASNALEVSDNIQSSERVFHQHALVLAVEASG